ncbi:LacI family transcriptional regulator [Azorhizobium oxalatiphilum]|uniref:LacI family transcriptional regulator n=1 Tax=Azorhizobium oxalatiphilum TaxID=980631 RepID=A0A917F496_9HYPH|nr:LacI family DNA-binding transcriptional regulator [Azorhizobium oxalatiphilum]GGF48973.1 LacI family transcriptional regulator [Azorhizobium oxalatiphilum]
MPRPVTIRTVAERAGCSIATVSRVLNGSARASAQVEARVRAAVAELGFRPSEIGRSLKTLRARTIGVVIPSLTNPVFAGSVAGIEAEARGRGHTPLLTATDYEPEREREIVSALVAQSVAGLVLTVADPDANATLDLLDAEAIPYVLVYNEPTQAERAAVTVDNGAASRALTEAFLAAGHRRVLFIAGRFSTSDRSRLRHQGYLAAMGVAGLSPEPVLELDYLADAAAHRAALEGLLAGPARPTGIICSNDLLALSVIAALREMGLCVPGDVSVAGFDGIAIGRLVSPALATVDQPTRRMGERAVERLFALIEGQGSRTVEHLPFELRTGGTLAPAPSLSELSLSEPEAVPAPARGKRPAQTASVSRPSASRKAL